MKNTLNDKNIDINSNYINNNYLNESIIYKNIYLINKK